MKHKSILTQLLTCFDFWTKATERKDFVKIVYFEFKKGFDKIFHFRLFQVFRSFRVPVNEIAWLFDFLSRRTQQVRLNGILSSKCNVLSGVPRRQCYRTVFFSIFFSMIFKWPRFLFANDCEFFDSPTWTFESQLGLLLASEWFDFYKWFLSYDANVNFR